MGYLINDILWSVNEVGACVQFSQYVLCDDILIYTKEREITLNASLLNWIRSEFELDLPELPGDYFDDGIIDLREIREYCKKLQDIFKIKNMNN